MRPRLLDLFCCEGGAATGYSEAGFEVVGVDIKRQRRYPFEFIQADAVAYAIAHAHEFDAIHASPPCQKHSSATRISGNPEAHACFIEATRAALIASGRPFVRHAMEMPWATLHGLNQAIPPRYTAMVGRQLMHEVQRTQLMEAA